jgi:low affinity Fe/Cu permease
MAGQRQERRRTSRLIDRVSDALGHEIAFGAVVLADLAVLALLAMLRTHDPNAISVVSLVVSLFTLVVVCAVQHTSSRESKALNLKLDELIRVTDARNDLIGAEDGSHRQLQADAAQLRQRRGAGAPS